MADRDTLAILAEEIAFSFDPLTAAFTSPAAYRDFVAELGWDFDVLPAELDDLRDPVQDVSDFVSAGPVADDDVLALLNAENVAFEEISNLKNVTSLPEDFRNEFPRQLVDFLLVEHLLLRHPRWGYFLLLLGLIRLEEVPEQAGRPAYLRRVLLVEDLGDFLKSPLDYLKTSYRWGDSDFDGARMIEGLHGMLDGWGLNARLQVVADPTLTELKAGALSLDGWRYPAL